MIGPARWAVKRARLGYAKDCRACRPSPIRFARRFAPASPTNRARSGVRRRAGSRSSTRARTTSGCRRSASRPSTARSTSAGLGGERAFLPDDVAAPREARDAAVHLRDRERPSATSRWSRSRSPTSSSSPGVVDCLELAGMPAFADERAARPGRIPLIVTGGPLTFSNPLPARAVRRRDRARRGRGDAARARRRRCATSPTARALLASLAAPPGLLRAGAPRRAPAGGRQGATTRSCPRARRSARRTPSCATMFLIEPERGCSRGCTYCVMRRSTNGGMRLVAPDEVIVADPGGRAPRRPGRRGGHRSPEIAEIVRELVDGGREVGHLVSLRADRLDRRARRPAGARRLSRRSPPPPTARRERMRDAHRAQDQGAAPAARGRARARARDEARSSST